MPTMRAPKTGIRLLHAQTQPNKNESDFEAFRRMMYEQGEPEPPMWPPHPDLATNRPALPIRADLAEGITAQPPEYRDVYQMLIDHAKGLDITKRRSPK